MMKPGDRVGITSGSAALGWRLWSFEFDRFTDINDHGVTAIVLATKLHHPHGSRTVLMTSTGVLGWILDSSYFGIIEILK